MLINNSTDMSKTLYQEVLEENEKDVLKYEVKLLEKYINYDNKRIYERVQRGFYIIFREIEEVTPNYYVAHKFCIDTTKPLSYYYNQIKMLYNKRRMKQNDIARMFGISQGNVSKIINDKL